MVRKDNPDRQDWQRIYAIYLRYFESVGDSAKHWGPLHENFLYEYGLTKASSYMTEKEKRELYRRLNEWIHSVNEGANNPAEKIRKHIELDLSELTASLKKIQQNALINTKALRIRDRTENLISKTSFWIPRKHREAIVGDILEDCRELRELDKSEWRIRIHIIWQLVWAFILLRPTALMDALKRILSTK